MTTERIKGIQQTTPYPESISVQQALLQVWNEVEQESSQLEPPKCFNCKYLITEEADEETKAWGLNEEHYCSKYEKFVKGLPSLTIQRRLPVSIDEFRFNCKYHKYK